MNKEQPITYEWLQANGFSKLERLERQPVHGYRRCIGLETVDAPGRMFVASEDLCIDVHANSVISPTYWFCFATRASVQNRHASVWLHIRHLHTVGDLILVYEGLTGRHFGPPSWKLSELAPPIYPSPKP